MWKTGRTRPAWISRRFRDAALRTDERHVPGALDRLAAARFAVRGLVRHAQPPIQHALRCRFPRLRPAVQIWPRRLELRQRDNLRLRHDAELDVLDRLGRIVLSSESVTASCNSQPRSEWRCRRRSRDNDAGTSTHEGEELLLRGERHGRRFRVGGRWLRSLCDRHRSEQKANQATRDRQRSEREV